MTPEELQEKIDMVAKDIEKMKSEGNNIKQVGVLQEYVEYLEYELEEVKKNGNGS